MGTVLADMLATVQHPNYNCSINTKSLKSLTIEAVTHLGGPQLNGKHTTRCCVSNVEEIIFLSRGYLRRHNFYVSDIANIIAKHLIQHHLTINYKQSTKFIHKAIESGNYDEEKQLCTVLFTPNIKQLPFIKDIETCIDDNDNKMKHDSDYNNDTCHLNFDFKILHHNCEVKKKKPLWYSNNGYLIQCGIIRMPKTTDKETFVNKFISMDENVLELKYPVTLFSMSTKFETQTDYLFLSKFDQGEYKHRFASFGINQRYKAKELYSGENTFWGKNGQRYVLKTNDSITLSITRKIQRKTVDHDHDDIESQSEQKEIKHKEKEKENQDNYNYKYEICWMKDCDIKQVYEYDKKPHVLQLDCQTNDYFVVFTSAPCTCKKKGFVCQVDIS